MLMDLRDEERMSHEPTNADGKGAIGPVTTFNKWHVPPRIGAGSIEDLMSVAMIRGGGTRRM